MIKINKGEEPEVVREWKRKYKNKKKREARYEDLNDAEDIKKQLKAALMKEQYSICCYCCCQIGENTSHIEHFKPRSKFGKDTLRYTNLHASCMGKNDKATKNNLNCGMAKKDQYDNLLLSPLEEECEKAFRYTSDGKIAPVQDAILGKRAEYTIDVLQLNNPVLKKARCAAVWEAGVMEQISEEEVERLFEIFSTPQDGKYVPFVDAILYRLRNG